MATGEPTSFQEQLKSGYFLKIEQEKTIKSMQDHNDAIFKYVADVFDIADSLGMERPHFAIVKEFFIVDKISRLEERISKLERFITLPE